MNSLKLQFFLHGLAKVALVLLFAMSLVGCFKSNTVAISGLFDKSVSIGQSVSKDELKQWCSNVEENEEYIVCVNQKEFDFYKRLVVQNGKVVDIYLREYDRDEGELSVVDLSKDLIIDKKPIHRVKGYGDLYLLGKNIYLSIAYSGLAEAVSSYEFNVFLDSEGDYLSKIESYESPEESKRGALHGYKLGQVFISPSLVNYSCDTKALVQLTICTHVDFKHFLTLYNEYTETNSSNEPEYIEINEPDMILLDKTEIIGLEDYTERYEDREVLMRRYGGKGRFANRLNEYVAKDEPTYSYYGVMESGDLVIIPSHMFGSSSLSLFSFDSGQKISFINNQEYIASLKEPKTIPIGSN